MRAMPSKRCALVRRRKNPGITKTFWRGKRCDGRAIEARLWRLCCTPLQPRQETSVEMDAFRQRRVPRVGAQGVVQRRYLHLGEFPVVLLAAFVEQNERVILLPQRDLDER